MEFDVLTLQDSEAMNQRFQVKDLVSEFSTELAEDIAAGVYDELFAETFRHLNVHLVIAVHKTDKYIGGMYLGTYMPVLISRRLYIDAVIVAQRYRRQGVLQRVLIPHMKQLARRLQCDSIEFTSSKPPAQAAYLKNGFTTPTTAFRMNL